MLQKVTRRPGPHGRKVFHLDEILSLFSGLPLASEGQAAIYRLIAFIMESEASPAGAAANAETAKRCVEEQLPFLRELNISGLYQIYNYDTQAEETENPYLDVWMEMQALRYGREHGLVPFNAWQKLKNPESAAGAKTEAAGAA